METVVASHDLYNHEVVQYVPLLFAILLYDITNARYFELGSKQRLSMQVWLSIPGHLGI